MDSNEFAEVVYLFGEDGLVAELRYRDFERHVDQQTPLALSVAQPAQHDNPVKAAFVVVGAGPRICGLAFFLVDLDAAGVPPMKFNMPLAYLVRNAAEGPDFGGGRVRMACRGQCPVPWHASNLWDPVEHPQLQIRERLSQAVERNRLRLAPRPVAATKVPRGSNAKQPQARPVLRKSVAAGRLPSQRVGAADSPAVRTTRSIPPARDAARFADLLPPDRSGQRSQAAAHNELDVAVLAKRLEALMVGQTNELMRLQAQHEQDILDRTAMHELQIDLYKKQIQRLQQQLTQALKR